MVDTRRFAVPLKPVIIAGSEEGCSRPIWGRRHSVGTHAKPQCFSCGGGWTHCLALLGSLLFYVIFRERCGIVFVVTLFLLAIGDWPFHGLQSHLRDQNSGGLQFPQVQIAPLLEIAVLHDELFDGLGDS